LKIFGGLLQNHIVAKNTPNMNPYNQTLYILLFYLLTKVTKAIVDCCGLTGAFGNCCGILQKLEENFEIEEV
jgi:hypothetical protein